MNENNHNADDREENYINPYVLETRRIREEMYREFNYDSDALVDYVNQKAEARGILSSPPPPPPAFPPSQEFIDFVAMLDRQEKEKQRQREAAESQRAKTPVRAVAAAHAGV